KRINSGVKKYEFRKLIHNKDKKEIENNTIAIYESYPVKAITLIIKVGKVYEYSINKLWKSLKLYPGMSREEFLKYFHGKKKGFAIQIKKKKEIKSIKSENIRKIYKDFNPHQNYREIKNYFPKLDEKLQIISRNL
ncbi:MAG: hypothetical protein AABX78_01925, partial [Nanoarchaeota archaeon]